jgi:hypothetical protein
MPSAEPAIAADNLTRVFSTYRKREGLLGSLRSFVRREFAQTDTMFRYQQIQVPGMWPRPCQAG